MDNSSVLRAIGWDSGWAAAFQSVAGQLFGDVRAGRVSRSDRGLCTVLTADGPMRATVGGAVLDRMAEDARLRPCTGDWCAVRVWPDGPVTVEAVLPRRTGVQRADVGGTSRGQVLAANLDVVAVVAGLVPEPVIGKLERMVALAWASGADPIVVLTKSDLVGDGAQVAADVADAALGVRALVCSVVTGEGLAELRTLVEGERTVGLLGSSGAGKSSLVNALAGAHVLATREIRQDGRGRHTSVRRELVVLPGGGAVVDTPGLRGVGLVDADPGLAATFADVEELVADCRFNDCAHASEPGCAVLEAVEAGRLPVRRLESWRRLQREMEWTRARTDVRLRAERAKAWKQRAKAHRRHRGGA
ncbi:MAG: ribosome small subunit-dependent GTPase A [Actinomycetota bacterium]|nr:ribosome small subunit-dependent GTPase A [Actinomycetota bacterium]